MKTTAIHLITAVLLFGAAETKTYVGVITDTMCAADHAHMNAGPDPKCVRDCVKAGYKYALLHEGRHVLKLSDQQTPEQYAGQKVRITGKLYEKTRILAVEKIEPAK